MLILTRRINENIIINDNIIIRVVDVYGSQVRLGIEAPLEVSVHREEVYERIQKEKAQMENKNNLGEIDDNHTNK